MYDDRVIAFDHQSISRDPIENIDWLLEHDPRRPDARLRHRLPLARRPRGAIARPSGPIACPATRKIRVHRTALVGAVNNGTILADVKPLERPDRHAVDGPEHGRRRRRRHGRSRPRVRPPDRGRRLPAAARPRLRWSRPATFLTELNAPAARAERVPRRSPRTTSRPTTSSSRTSGTSSPTSCSAAKPNDSMVRIDSVVRQRRRRCIRARSTSSSLLDETRGHRARALLRDPGGARSARRLARRGADRVPVPVMSGRTAEFRMRIERGTVRRERHRVECERRWAASGSGDFTVPFSDDGARELRPQGRPDTTRASEGSNRPRWQLARNVRRAAVRRRSCRARSGELYRTAASGGASRPARACASRSR